jgi:NhaA family Na+:H+ antiporter
VAVAVGLVLGKPIGIGLFALAVIQVGWARLPTGVTTSAVLGGGLLAGIGFTMSLFIAGLALEGQLLDAAKIGTLSGSVVSAALGMGLLAWRLPRDKSLPRSTAAA